MAKALWGIRRNWTKFEYAKNKHIEQGWCRPILVLTSHIVVWQCDFFGIFSSSLSRGSLAQALADPAWMTNTLQTIVIHYSKVSPLQCAESKCCSLSAQSNLIHNRNMPFTDVEVKEIRILCEQYKNCPKEKRKKFFDDTYALWCDNLLAPHSVDPQKKKVRFLFHIDAYHQYVNSIFVVLWDGRCGILVYNLNNSDLYHLPSFCMYA